MREVDEAGTVGETTTFSAEVGLQEARDM